MVCEMDINSSGEVKKYRFYPAVMNSHKRFTYTTVAEMLADPKGKAAQENEALLPHVQELDKLLPACWSRRAPSAARSISRPSKPR